jgi:hypothetical protein
LIGNAPEPGRLLVSMARGTVGGHAIYLMVLPTADPDHWRAFTNDPEMIAYLADDFRSSGAMQLGFATMSVAIASRWFRRGDRWAWIVFWYFPVLFAWSILTTWAVGLFLVLTLVAIAALVASYAQRPGRPRLGRGAGRTDEGQRMVKISVFRAFWWRDPLFG